MKLTYALEYCFPGSWAQVEQPWLLPPVLLGTGIAALGSPTTEGAAGKTNLRKEPLQARDACRGCAASHAQQAALACHSSLRAPFAAGSHTLHNNQM